MNLITRRGTRLIPLALAILALSPFRAQAQVVINTGTPGSPIYAVGPIYLSSTMYYKYSRYAYLYTQDELEAAGIMSGAVIYQVGWMKSTDASAAGPADFKIYMKNSTTAAYSNATEMWSNLSNGATLSYHNTSQAIPATAYPDFNNFTLNTPFTYTGGSLEILTEWDISLAIEPIATGSFEWENTSVVDRIYGKGNSSLPTSLSSTTNNVSIDDLRPVIQFTLDATSGITAVAPAISLMLFPNPADQVLNIVLGNGGVNGKIAVLDMLGQEVLSIGQPAGNTARMDVSQLAPGVYFLHARTKAGPVVKRFVVR
jgi:hypothetical protein